MFARSTDGGITWSAPVRINDDVSTTNTQWFGTMSVAPNGRIDVVWLDTRDAQPGLDSSSLYYSYSVDQGFTWSANERMSAGFDPHLGYPNQDKMGDYFDMISDNSGAHLAWANTLNGEEDVYYSHIIPQVIIASNGNTEFLNLSIYPNPSTGFVAISGVEKNSRIEVYTMLGEKRLSVNSIGSKNEIDISSQPAGVYILKVVNQNGSSMIRKISKDQ